MLRLNRKKKNIIVDLGSYVVENGIMPVPTYSKNKERKHIVGARSIWSKFR